MKKMPYYALYMQSKNPQTGSNGATASSGDHGNGLAGRPATSNVGAGESNLGEAPHVYRSKPEALEVLKLNKDARLREFSKEEDAIKYAQTGYEPPTQPKHVPETYTSTAAVEKAAFRAPSKQDLIEFRKIIERGDYERVKSIIWDNPRYLVSSGDTPTTLKEGYRYNAMHICAISKKPRIAQLILETVSDTRFVNLLTGNKTDNTTSEELCANLLDYYLNIPEKGRSETPLHLATKLGNIEVIEVLTSYPECKMTRNSEGQLAKDIVCSRMASATPELKDKIKALLEERFYVPVLRSIDNVIPPQIGQPFSSNNPPIFNCDPLSPEVKIQALAGPMNKEQATQFARRWKTPPRLGSSTSSPIANNPFISPRKPRLHGSSTPGQHSFDTSASYFGSPLSAATPTKRRGPLFITSSPIRSPLDLSKSLYMTPEGGGQPSVTENIHRQENDANGNQTSQDEIDNIENHPSNETNNNHQAEEMEPKQFKSSAQQNMLKTTLVPKTPLIKRSNAFTAYREQYVTSPVVFDAPNLSARLDMSSASLFNVSSSDYLKSPGFKERHIKIMDTEKGLEVIGRELAKEHKVEWREYWDFLNAFIDIAAPDGLLTFENYLAQRIREKEMAKKASDQAKARTTALILDDVCNALDKFGLSANANRNGFCGDQRWNVADDNPATSSVTAATQTNPYTCVEKSLQVFAKRMTKTITHNLENVASINDTLVSELKRLKSLICSFKEDPRFVTVDFSKVHARIANLIASYLENSQEVDNDTKSKIRNIIKNLLIISGERREHIECVGSRVLLKLGCPSEHQPEDLKTEEMCLVAWQGERECACQWETNLSRKTSRRNRMEARYRNHQQVKEQEMQQKCDIEEWRSNPEEEEEELFWSDFGGSDTDDEDEIFFTPVSSPSQLSLVEDVEARNTAKVFIYGNEPTKRDLDVLNAIFHVPLDNEKYPNIVQWKAALTRYTTEEMDYFPSPAVIKKSQSLIRTANTRKDLPKISSIPVRKQLFRSKTSLSTSPPPISARSTILSAGGGVLTTTTTSQITMNVNALILNPASPSAKIKPQSPVVQPFNAAKRQLKMNTAKPPLSNLLGQPASAAPVTPVNKAPGLFSAYRDTQYSPLSSSPLLTSQLSNSSPIGGSSDSRYDSDGGSLLNVSLTD